MASLTTSARWTLSATAQPSPDAPSPLLSLPAELRTEIFTYVLALPAPQKLRYKCPHLHLRPLRRTRRTQSSSTYMHREDTKCTHSNAGYAAPICPHHKVQLPPISHEKDFWVLIMTSRQVYWETVGMVAAFNTLSFADVEDLRCFGVMQREIASSIHHASDATILHMHRARNLEVSSGLVHVNDVRPMVEELVRLKDLEHITLRAIHGDVRSALRIFLLRTLIEAEKLPKLKLCRTEVPLDTEGPCRNCHRSGCLYFRFLVGRDMAVAAKINEGLAEALAGRSASKESSEQESSECRATDDVRRFIGPVCVVQRCVLP